MRKYSDFTFFTIQNNSHFAFLKNFKALSYVKYIQEWIFFSLDSSYKH